MVRLKLDQKDLAYTTLLEQLSGAQVKDCFQNEQVVYFVISPGDMGRAIGKKGMHIKRLEKEFKKKVKMVEYDEDVRVFVARLIAPLLVKDISLQEQYVVLKPEQRKTKSLLIGRDAKHLHLLERGLLRLYQRQIKII